MTAVDICGASASMGYTNNIPTNYLMYPIFRFPILIRLGSHQPNKCPCYALTYPLVRKGQNSLPLITSSKRSLNMTSTSSYRLSRAEFSSCPFAGTTSRSVSFVSVLAVFDTLRGGDGIGLRRYEGIFETSPSSVECDSETEPDRCRRSLRAA